MNRDELQLMTSAEWNRIDDVMVYDPDGWDRSGNFYFSWYEERITVDEYIRRRNLSTCTKKKDIVGQRAFDMFMELKQMYASLNNEQEKMFCEGMKRLVGDFGVEDVFPPSYASGVADTTTKILAAINQ